MAMHKGGKEVVKEAEDVNNVDWPNYFANSVSMPLSEHTGTSKK